ncbi:MAG TPA: GAF and ANTAR domain-containing protein [Pseudonocardia sp.]
MAQERDWPALAAGLAEMARDLLAQGSVRETLDRIVHHAVELVDGCEAAGIMVLRDGRVETLAASDNVVVASDRIQAEVGEGPCFDATRKQREVYRIADFTTTEPQWPRFAPKAAELGVGSMMGFLLYTRERNNLGALDLYSSRPHAFTEECEHVGWLLASHAAVGMAAAEHVAHLHEALDSRQMIGEATGIVMARYGLTESDAFDRIVKASQNTNTKVRDLAQTISYTGDLPPGA